MGDADHPYTVFDSTIRRSRDGPLSFLDGYQGYLQSDAYAGYHAAHDAGATYVGCWSHARRKFYDVRDQDPVRSHQALAWIRRLFALEDQWRDLSDEDRRQARQQDAAPILHEFFDWVHDQRRLVPPKTGPGQALFYTWQNWTGLTRYVEQGYLPIDNNRSERGLRGVAVGRNNWLFFGSEQGGQTAAVLLSVIASCKQCGVDPYAYLHDVLPTLPTCDGSTLDSLLPDRWLLEHPQAVWLRRTARPPAPNPI